MERNYSITRMIVFKMLCPLELWHFLYSITYMFDENGIDILFILVHGLHGLSLANVFEA